MSVVRPTYIIIPNRFVTRGSGLAQIRYSESMHSCGVRCLMKANGEVVFNLLRNAEATYQIRYPDHSIFSIANISLVQPEKGPRQFRELLLSQTSTPTRLTPLEPRERCAWIAARSTYLSCVELHRPCCRYLPGLDARSYLSMSAMMGLEPYTRMLI